MFTAPCLKCWSYIFRVSAYSGPQLLRAERTISECKRQVNVPAGVRISTVSFSVDCLPTRSKTLHLLSWGPFKRPDPPIYRMVLIGLVPFNEGIFEQRKINLIQNI